MSAAATAASLAATPAALAGGWLAANGGEPLEQRVAVAVTPSRTTVWTSVRLTGPAGPVAIVVPAAPGASLDISSDAWFEALEVATAPRVFPPEGASPWCPGEDGEAHPFHVAGDLDHQASAALADVVVLPDAAAVGSWASEHGFTVSPAIAQALGSMSGVRFLVAQVQSGGAEMLTPTLRVVSTGPAALPVALTAAGQKELRVTTWLLGPGRAELAGTAPVTIDLASLEWNASDATSNLDEARLLALQGQPDAALVEAASHAALSQNVSIAAGTAAIDGVAGTFFERAAAYAEIGADPVACTTQAAIALASSAAVATSCPRADLGVVDGVESCAEAPVRGQIDPAALRCGTLADDLAVALSGAAPAQIWLTRTTVLVPAQGVGTPYAVSFEDDAAASPVLTAETIDVSECEQGEGGSGPSLPPTSSSSGGSGSPRNPEPGSSGGVSSGDGSSGDWVFVDASGCSCSGTYEYVEYDDGSEDVPAESTSSGDDCGDDSSSSSEDDCGGDSSESAESSDDCGDDTSESGSSDDCGGDSTESSGDDCSGDSTDSSDDCSGDSSGGDSCSGDSGGDSCSGGSGDDCSVAGSSGRRRRGPRLSPMVLGLLFVVAPMRRWGSRRRRSGLGPMRAGPRLAGAWAALVRAADRLERWTR
jgi:hypothetical protein